VSKYRAVRTTVDGITFASKAEARRYQELKMLVKAGVIGDLRLQPRYPFVVNRVKIGAYVGDFLYERDGVEIVEDVKGVLTPVYRLKKKLMKAIYGIEIQEVTAR
jgi:hypothetical protein